MDGEEEKEEIEFDKIVEEYGLWKLGKHPKQKEFGDSFFDHPDYVDLDLTK